ncbi:hypothetical protein J6590_062924 [Homalodisca vitripennis]|nr:hypothetical protein J6590_062924 [Homalodisca vitripennis]
MGGSDVPLRPTLAAHTDPVPVGGGVCAVLHLSLTTVQMAVAAAAAAAVAAALLLLLAADGTVAERLPPTCPR